MSEYILYHADSRKNHKYIRKEKINGKWRYYYKDTNTSSKYGSYTDKNGSIYTVTKSNKLFSKTKEKTVKKIVNNEEKLITDVTYHEGLLTRFISKAKRKISKILKKTEKQKGNPKILKKGAKAVSEWLNKSEKQIQIPKQHKYIKRIETSSGKYRYFYTQEEYDRYLNRQKYQENEPEFMKKIPKISDNYSTKENDMSDINEGYDPYDSDKSTNCANCTVAYELRCRGYDVQAAGRDTDKEYMAGKKLSDIYENADTIPLKENGKEDKYEDILNNFGKTRSKKYNYNADIVKDAIIKHSGKNTRGEIGVIWKSGSGHSMVYEVDKKGEITIRDCQINRSYKLDDIVDVVNNISITRTDNLKLKKNVVNCVETNKHEVETVDRESLRFITDR